MPQSDGTTDSRHADIQKVMTEAVLDPETYARLIGIGRSAIYRALSAGEPITPIRIGKAYRIPTRPLRKLLCLECEPTAA